MDKSSTLHSIHDVPQEILEYVFSLLSPYRDYRSVMLVCKLWHKIIFDVKQQELSRFRHAVSESSLQWHRLVTDADATSITERYSHSACYHDKCLYVFGGCTATGTTFNDLWQLDLGKRQWSRPWAVGTYPSPKACATLVSYRDSLILFGGWSHPTPYPLHQAARFFNQLHIYEPSTCRWSHVVPSSSPPGIAGHAASIVGDMMVVFGGSHQQISCNEVWVLDLVNMAWMKKNIEEPLPQPRYGHSQVVLDKDHLLIIGGCGGPNMQFSDIWLLTMKGTSWSWRKMDVLNPEHAAMQLWCHPACKVGDKIVVLSKSSQHRSGTPPMKPPILNFDSRNPGDSTPAARDGRPSIRPNAMHNRERLLSILQRYEERIRQARNVTLNPMYVHLLDVSLAVEHGTVSWQQVAGNAINAPEETIFYSLVCGRAELIVFGGIETDLSRMQRGVNVQTQTVSANVHFLRASNWLH